MNLKQGDLIARDPAAKKDRHTAHVSIASTPHLGNTGIVTAHAHTEAVATTAQKEPQVIDHVTPTARGLMQVKLTPPNSPQTTKRIC